MEDYNLFQQALKERMAQGVKKETKRHRTPGYIQACVMDALIHMEGMRASMSEDSTAEECPCRDPFGGFTDVGTHTGCLPRDTTWPLFLLIRSTGPEGGQKGEEDMHSFSCLALLHFELWLLMRQAALVNTTSTTPKMLDKAAELSDDGHNVSTVEECMEVVRSHLHTEQGNPARTAGQRLQISKWPGTSDVLLQDSDEGSLRFPEEGFRAARLRSLQNLGSLSLLPEGSTIEEMLAWVKLPQWTENTGGGAVAGQLVLRGVETQMFRWATRGFRGPGDVLPAAATLVEVLEEYRGHVSKFMDSPACQATKLVELRSREILVIWVATCLIHKACCLQHPITTQYGIGLDWRALEHLVLSNRQAVDAALSVSNYVKAHTQLDRPLFSLVDGDQATFKMAEQFARDDTTLKKLLKEENSAATARITMHWKEVVRKQRIAADLRRRISKEEDRLAKLQARHYEARSKLLLIFHFAAAAAAAFVKSLFFEITSCKGSISNMKHQLEEAENAPPHVIQPLPQDLDLARRWLFFLYMPPSFRLISQATFLAQQALLPYPRSSVRGETVVEEYKTHVADHYREYQQGIYHTPNSTRTGEAGRVELWIRTGVPKDVGPRHVDSMYCKTDGVWYPDSAVEICWTGSGSQHDRIGDLHSPFNPFADIKPEKTIESFTERLQGPAKTLQWSFPLDHPAVRTTVLPALYHLGTLYATNDGKVGLKWRAHWDEPDDVLSNLRIELDRLADELEEAPREHDSVLLLGTIAAYLSGRRFVWMVYNAAAHLDANIKEAELACEDRVQQGLRDRQNHLWKVSLLCYASGPFDNEDKVTDAAHMIKLMVLINHGCIFMEGQSEESKRVSTHLDVRCQNIMALSVDALMEAVKSNPGCLTDAVRLVLPPLPERLEWRQLGPHASFEAEGADGHLYSINILDGTVLLDGSPPSRLSKDIVTHRMYRDQTIIVVRPVSFLGHDTYFVIILRCDPRSMNPKERHQGGAERIRYSCLRIPLHLMQRPWPSLLNEHRAELTDELVLAQQSSLGLNILAKLEASKFIHTYSTSKQPIMISNSGSPMGASGDSSARPGRSEDPSFKAEDPARPGRSEDPSLKAEDPGRPGRSEDPSFKAEDPARPGRSEDPSFKAEDPARPGRSEDPSSKVETGSPPHESMSLLWELPRYGLEFEHINGIFLSRYYTGFKLADEQQLASSTDTHDHAVDGSIDFTLPNFQQYLVLERIHQEGHTFQAQQSNRMIILPDGIVALDKRETDGGVQPNAEDLIGVSVAVSGATDASIKIHRYEIHPRFGHLVASSIVSRLQLAALYSATSSLLPEPRSRMTGAQLAMRLVRWSWTNRQLTEQEQRHLESVARCGFHLAPGLHLLCLELERSSSIQKHLHENDKGQGSSTNGGSQSLGLKPSFLQDPKFASMYLLQSKLGNYGGWCQNSRMLLHPAEEESAMGISTSKQAPPHWIRKGEHCQLELSACSIPSDMVKKVEEDLLALVVPQPRSRRHQAPPYPLLGRGEQDGATRLEVDMHAELKDSWKAYHASPEFSLSQNIECVKEHFSTSQDFVTQNRKEIEQYLLQGLHGVPELQSTRDGNGSIRRSFRMLRSADGAADAGLLDLMEAALHSPDHLLNYNPFLTERSRQVLHQAILTWLQRCVLEDRLKRLELLSKAEETQKLLQVLGRRLKYDVATRLIHEPGAIAQLNMGEGKTRVILPMLVLHLGKGEH
eukprot:gene21581-28577_t